MQHNISRKIAITGALGSLTIVLGVTRLGLIPWVSGASITILQLPVIIAAILEGPIVGLFVGFIFGLYSLIQAAMTPIGLDLFFVNPLISILPRLCIGPITWLIYHLIQKWKKLPAIIISSFLGAISNTLLVLFALFIAKAITWPLFWTVFFSNGILEACVSTLITTLIVCMWSNISLRKKSHFSEITDSENKKD